MLTGNNSGQKVAGKHPETPGLHDLSWLDNCTWTQKLHFERHPSELAAGNLGGFSCLSTPDIRLHDIRQR